MCIYTQKQQQTNNNSLSLALSLFLNCVCVCCCVSLFAPERDSLTTLSGYGVTLLSGPIAVYV